jgi:hypothetical protein
MDSYCQKIVETLSRHSDTSISLFRQAVEILDSMGEITGDRLKRQVVLEEMLNKVS